MGSEEAEHWHAVACNAGGVARRLLDLDPDLGAGLSAQDRQAAQRGIVVRVQRAGEGRWHPPAPADDATLGVLVLDGLLVRRTRHHDRTAAELVGEGDLLRPWDQDEFSPVALRGSCTVLAPLSYCVLDRRHATLLARFPALLAALMARATRRTQWLTFQNLIAATPSVQQRLSLLLWQLAQRWGRVRPQGLWLPLRFSHETLGHLIGARRPSVTSGIGQLERRAVIRRERGGWWLLDERALLDGAPGGVGAGTPCAD